MEDGSRVISQYKNSISIFHMITEDKGDLDVDTSVFVIKQEIYKCIKFDLENGSELSKVLSKINKLID